MYMFIDLPTKILQIYIRISNLEAFLSYQFPFPKADPGGENRTSYTYQILFIRWLNVNFIIQTDRV